MAAESDIVLIHFEDKPMVFARVEMIEADVKPDWYQVKLLLLQVPLQVVTWILRDVYINGAEFTMGGRRMRLEKVICPMEENQKKTASPKTLTIQKDSNSNVISLSDLKKK